MLSRLIASFTVMNASKLFVLASLRRRKFQTVSVILVITLSVLLLGLATIMLPSITNSFDHLFTELNGPHLRFMIGTFPTPAELETISHVPNVAAISEPEEYAAGSLLIDNNKVPAEFQSFPIQQPAIGRLLIVHGQLLSGTDPMGVILDEPLANTYNLKVGDKIEVVTVHGLVTVHIRGTSFDVNHDSANDGSLGHLYLLRSALARLSPQSVTWAVGVRLVHPENVQSTQNQLVQTLQTLKISSYTFLQDDNWLSYQNDFGSFSRLGATLLLAFGFIGIGVAVIIIANLISGQVLAQQRNMGILKVLGFTPGQIISLLVCEYMVLGAIGACIGLALATLISFPILSMVQSSLLVPIFPTYQMSSNSEILLGILLIIALFAVWPAWRAGRLPAVEVIRPVGKGHTMERKHRAHIGWLFTIGAPLPIAFGLRSIERKPLRASLVAITLLVGVIAATFGVGLISTIRLYVQDPGLQGIYSDASIDAGLYDPLATQHLITTNPDIASYYTTYYQPGTIAGLTRTLNMFLTSGNMQRPARYISAGRWYKTDQDEVVVTLSAMHSFHMHLGEKVPVTFVVPVRGQIRHITIPYTVVGVISVASFTSIGYVPLQSLLSHTPIASTTLLAAITYEVNFRPGVNAQKFAHTLLMQTEQRIDVSIQQVAPPSSIYQLSEAMTLLCIILMLIAGVSVFNSMMLTTHEQFHDFGTFKAIGCTPMQIALTVINGAIILGLLATFIGIPLGIWLTTGGLNVLAQNFGNIEVHTVINWPTTLLIIPVTIAVAIIGALVPARHAAYLSTGEILHYE